MQLNGKIVITGYTNKNTVNLLFAVARYKANGSYDTTFCGDGKMKVSFSPSSASANALALQPSDGKYVLGGYAVGDGYNFALARLLP